jgi:hypothetical protein
MSGVLVAAALVASGMTIDPATPQPAGFYVGGDVGLQDAKATF